MEIARNRDSGLKWCIGSLQNLERMARAMGNLVRSPETRTIATAEYEKLEFSLGMFHTTLSEISGGSNAAGKKVGTKGSANALRNNFEFQKLLRDVEAEMNCIRIGKAGKTRADRHPKMQKTLELVNLTYTRSEKSADDLATAIRALLEC